MKTKTTITETKEVEIDLPDYVWDKSCHWYKITGENSAIEACHASHISSIKTCSVSLAVAGTWEECSEQEFNEAFNKALSALHNITYPETATLLQDIAKGAENTNTEYSHISDEQRKLFDEVFENRTAK